MPLSLLAQGIPPDAQDTLVMTDTQDIVSAEAVAVSAYEGNPAAVIAASGITLSVAAGSWVSKCTHYTNNICNEH